MHFREVFGDIFYPKTYKDSAGQPVKITPDVLFVPTNGFIKGDGNAVMGRGVAKQAVELMPQLPGMLGEKLVKYGNQINRIGTHDGMGVYSFPVKPHREICGREHQNVVGHMRYRFKPGDAVPGWACRADVRLVTDSAKQAVHLARINGWRCCVLPRVGCGNGELSWDRVRLVLNCVLNDRFVVVSYRV
jgi:hypothetical protein